MFGDVCALPSQMRTCQPISRFSESFMTLPDRLPMKAFFTAATLIVFTPTLRLHPLSRFGIMVGVLSSLRNPTTKHQKQAKTPAQSDHIQTPNDVGEAMTA
jgi:hypothetical protein